MQLHITKFVCVIYLTESKEDLKFFETVRSNFGYLILTPAKVSVNRVLLINEIIYCIKKVISTLKKKWTLKLKHYPSAYNTPCSKIFSAIEKFYYTSIL